MTDIFSNIVLEHERFIFRCTEICKTLAENIAFDKASAGQFANMDPERIGYVDQMRKNLGDVRTSLNKVNNRYDTDYKQAATDINPVGLSVPKTDYEDDDEIEKYYKDLRTVVLDKFQESSKITENGEGWIRFIDTLLTPEEVAKNYQIPEFNSVYTMFVKEKSNVSVTREHVAAALESISTFDAKISKLIKEADEYILDRDKERYLLMDKGPAFSFTESVQYLAEAMLLEEKDFLIAQSLEVRKHALTESLKNAHMVLFGLCTHNPRNIKESSICRDTNLSVICGVLEEAINNPELYIEVKEEKSLQETNIDKSISKLEKKTESSSKKFLDKYKSRASSSSCIGVYMKNWYTPIDVEKDIKQSVAILLSVLDKKTIQKDSISRLETTYESLKYMDKIVSSGSSSGKIDKVKSPAIKKAIKILPFVDAKEEYWYCNKYSNHKVTPRDIKDAINFLEKDSKTLIKAMKKERYRDCKAVESHKKEMATPSIRVTGKERLIMNIGKLKWSIITKLNQKKADARINQINLISIQSRTAILKASRIVVESAMTEEDKAIKELIESYNETCAELNTIIYE